MSKSEMKKGLKISRYTHIFFYPDGLRLAYNTLTGSLIELKGKEGDRFEAILRENPRISSSKCRDYDALATSGFLVDFDINELNVVRELVRIGKLKKHFAGITILPTLGCNFRCPYCFEGHKKHLMNQKVQDALIKFVDKCLLPKSNGFSINWFGGEPLLGFSIIESLSLRFRKICYEAGLSCPTASIVTNGYLLTNDKVIQLMALGVKSAQVTLDGPPKVHNRRRPLAGGQGSFDRIIENLRHIPEGFDVSIRINVDADNKDSVFELLKLLFNEGIIPKATPYIANVESFSGKCRSSEWGFLSSEQFSQFKKELYTYCLEAGIPWFSNDTPTLAAYGLCLVDQRKGFVVEPDGKLLKCWAEAGNNTGTPVAHLLNEESWNNIALSILQRRSPLRDKECSSCKILPVCMGGCPQIRQNLWKQNIKRCPPIRYTLAEEVRTLYLHQVEIVKRMGATQR